MLKNNTLPIKKLTLEELLKISEGELYSSINQDLVVEGVASPDKATEKDLIFLNHIKFLPLVNESKSAVCITYAHLAEHIPKKIAVIISSNPYKAYALVAQSLYYRKNIITSIAASAVISKTAILGTNCIIKDHVVIGDGVILGDGITILANSVIGNDVKIGEYTYIGSNASIENSIIGKRAIIHSGARLGQDGFGFASDLQGHYKVPQLGRVIIGDDVEIGANTTVDRGALGNTEIGNMTKIDNLVHIAHNVKIGVGCIIIAQVGIAGSTEIGDGVVLGGQVGVAGHLKIVSGVQIAAQSGVISNVLEAKKYGGTPTVPIRDWHKQSIMLNKIIKKEVVK